ncbi:MAG: hypothetical protein QXX41_10865 [Nitrososphaerota archaeon]
MISVSLYTVGNTFILGLIADHIVVGVLQCRGENRKKDFKPHGASIASDLSKVQQDGFRIKGLSLSMGKEDADFLWEYVVAFYL